MLRNTHEETEVRDSAGQLMAAFGKTGFPDIVSCSKCSRFMRKDSFWKHKKKSDHCLKRAYSFSLHPETNRPFCYKCGRQVKTVLGLIYHLFEVHTDDVEELKRLGINFEVLGNMQAKH